MVSMLAREYEQFVEPVWTGRTLIQPRFFYECLTAPLSAKVALASAGMLQSAIVRSVDTEEREWAEKTLGDGTLPPTLQALITIDEKPLKTITRCRMALVYRVLRKWVQDHHETLSPHELVHWRKNLSTLMESLALTDPFAYEPPCYALAHLPNITLKQRDTLPLTPAVYYLWAPLRVAYIGSTKNMFKRWQGHHRQADFDAIGTETLLSWEDLSGREHELRQREAEAIALHNPVLNKMPVYPHKQLPPTDTSPVIHTS
jgi:hypothetical protein